MKTKLLNLTKPQLDAIKGIASWGYMSEKVPFIHGNTIKALVKKRIVQKSKNNIDYVLTNRGKSLAIGL